MPPIPSSAAAARARRGEQGFSLVEYLVAATIVAMAVMVHASGSLAGYRLARSEEGRSVALQTLRRFIEHLRADEDWAGLYDRLWSKVDPQAVPGGTRYAPSAYYPDFETPSAIGDVRVRVDVPYAADAASAALVLREDADLPTYGLPYDLNGDGVVDGAARNADYRALPVVIHWHWQPPGEIAQSMRVTTWLRGEHR